jgi:predicted benzoate:H+ symporter BenE
MWQVHSRMGSGKEIPTALQAALLFGVLGSGGFPSLWKVAQYHFCNKTHPISFLLKTAVWVLVAAVVLGGFITAADTWLHKVSSTVLFIATREITDTRQFQAYGRTAVPYCLLTQVSQIVTDVLDKVTTNRCRGDF